MLITDVLTIENQTAANNYIAKLNEILNFKNGAIEKKVNANVQIIILENTIKDLNNQYAIETDSEKISQIVNDRKVARASIEDYKDVVKANYLGELISRMSSKELSILKGFAEREWFEFVEAVEHYCAINKLVYEDEKSVILEHPFCTVEEIIKQINDLKDKQI